MSQTIAYLQSESAEKGIEIGLLVNYLLYDSIKAGASDIHIEPWESTLVVRIRLSGVLTNLCICRSSSWKRSRAASR